MHLLQSADILRVNLGLEEVEVIDLTCIRCAITLHLYQLGLGKIDAFEPGRLRVSIFGLSLLLLLGLFELLLLVEDLRLLLPLSALSQVIDGLQSEVVSSVTVNRIFIIGLA